MTSPGDQVRAQLDELASAGSRWDVMTADLDPGAPPSPGDVSNPTGAAVLAIHGAVRVSTAQLQELLAGHAAHVGETVAATGAQEGMSASQLKDIMGMLTSAGKDVMGIGTNLGQTATQALTQVGTAVTQAGTTGMNAVITAVTTGAKGGGAASGLTAPGNLDSLHDNTTHREGDGDDRTAADKTHA